MGKWKKLLLLTAPALIFGFSRAYALSQGYNTSDSGLKQGMAVSLSDDSNQSQKSVKRADFRDANKVLGISVGFSDSLITQASGADKVYVADSGQANAFVCDVDGTVKRGDSLSLSPLAGILMKNNDPSQGIVGVALANFPGAYQTVSTKDTKGEAISVKVAQMPIQINLIAQAKIGSNNNWLIQLGKAVTGRNLSPQRVAAAGAIFLALVVIEGAIAYGVVKNSLSAIGRNPLANKEVKMQAARSFAFAAAFLIIGGAVISIIIWL